MDSDVGVRKWVKIQKAVKLGSQNKTGKNKLIFKKVMLQSRADCLKILELSLVESVKASHRPVWTPEAPGDN